MRFQELQRTGLAAKYPLRPPYSRQYPAFGSVGCSRDGASPQLIAWTWPALPLGTHPTDGPFAPQPRTPRRTTAGNHRAIEDRSPYGGLASIGPLAGRFVFCSPAFLHTSHTCTVDDAVSAEFAFDRTPQENATTFLQPSRGLST